MTTLAHRLVRRHGFIVGSVSGLAVLAIALVQGVLTTLLAHLTYLPAGAPEQWLWGAGSALQFGTVSVPLAIGVVLSFWLTAVVGQFVQALGYSASIAGGQFVTVAPLVILVGFVVRMWLERHPFEHEVVGDADTL